MTIADTPLLLVIAGAPATGKTTLSRLLADRLCLPVVNRDAVKEGAFFTSGQVVRSGTPEAARTFELFYEVVDAHLRLGVSVIAETAFRPDFGAVDELLSRQGSARLRLVRCETAGESWFDRFQARPPRVGHLDPEFAANVLAGGGPDASVYRLELPGVPTLVVDTSDGYHPGLDDLVAFAAPRADA